MQREWWLNNILPQPKTRRALKTPSIFSVIATLVLGVAGYIVSLAYLIISQDTEGYIQLIFFTLAATVITFIFSYLMDYLKGNE